MAHKMTYMFYYFLKDLKAEKYFIELNANILKEIYLRLFSSF
ncbi:hypothetical protein SAMN05444360_11939 [Chryseobacterium carnipullorum]|nr:hypothetical protein SAMN05444360_11939 [Chryseobacterium carnipullorum]